MRYRVTIDYSYKTQAKAWQDHLNKMGLPIPNLPGLIAGTAKAELTSTVIVGEE